MKNRFYKFEICLLTPPHPPHPVYHRLVLGSGEGAGGGGVEGGVGRVGASLQPASSQPPSQPPASPPPAPSPPPGPERIEMCVPNVIQYVSIRTPFVITERAAPTNNTPRASSVPTP